jgi:CheY-like chemotaxis protein
MEKRFFVLVVEDDSDVLDALKLYVESFSNASLLSANGYLAAATWLNGMERIDLILCDVILRGEMDGIDVAELAVKMHPDIAVVLFSADPKSSIERLSDRYSFVRKPFGREEITQHIDKAFLRLRPLDERV